MKNIVHHSILIIILLVPMFIQSTPISDSQAKIIAGNFYHTHIKRSSIISKDDFDIRLVEERMEKDHKLFYIFNINNEGFVIVSGCDATIPVLAFSNSGIYNVGDSTQPPAFVEMLDGYKKEILYTIENRFEATPETALQWETLQQAIPCVEVGRSVNQLLTTTWNQNCNYNALCPADAGVPSGYCGHVPVGCVALTMAQVMKYWDYPQTGSGSNSYNAYPYGTQYADFGNTTYNWNDMPNSLYSSNLSVATLLYHCAVSIEMQFGTGFSGAYTSDARGALVDNFNYAADAQFYNKYSYSNSVWENMLRNEIDLGQPVIYRGEGASGGHAWVCDGYSNDNYFHMNWGWGGYLNGNFYLSSLNPAGINLSNNQAAIMGIFPDETIAAPPVNLQAVVVGNNVNLSWLPPFEPQWLHWDNGTTVGAVGITEDGNYNAAARWTAEDMEAYNGLFITKVSVYIASILPVYELKIWKGANAANLIYTQPVVGLNAQSWNVVELDNPLQIDASDEVYIGFAVLFQPAGQYAIGRDSGPALIERGGLVSFNGGDWTELYLMGMDANWNIQVFVDATSLGKSAAAGKPISEKPVNTGNILLSCLPIEPVSTFTDQDVRAILGYNVYRNNQKINNNIVSTTSYTDQNTPAGIHSYTVSSVNNAGESAPASPIMVTVGMDTQTFQLSVGWNSISSYLMPVNPDVEYICSPVANNMVIMLGADDFYYPEMNINTIETWDIQQGYLMKVNENCELPFQGFLSGDVTMNLQEGWNLISVLSVCPVEVGDLFNNILSDVEIVKDAAGTGVYWPSKGVNTLNSLKQGKAYFIKMLNDKTLIFPVCD